MKKLFFSFVLILVTTLQVFAYNTSFEADYSSVNGHEDGYSRKYIDITVLAGKEISFDLGGSWNGYIDVVMCHRKGKTNYGLCGYPGGGSTFVRTSGISKFQKDSNVYWDPNDFQVTFSEGYHRVIIQVMKNNYQTKDRFFLYRIHAIKPIIPNHKPVAYRKRPTSQSITLNVNESKKFEVRGTDIDGDIDYARISSSGQTTETDYCQYGCSEQTASKSYQWSRAGSYTVKGYVRDDRGNSDSVTWYVKVFESTKWKTVKPVPLSPGNVGEGNYAVINTTTPTLRWQKVEGAPKYWVAIHDTDTGEEVFSPKLIVSGNTLSYKVPAGKLKKGHRYFWDLATIDANGNVVQWTEKEPVDRRRFFRIYGQDLAVLKEDIKIVEPKDGIYHMGDRIKVKLLYLHNKGSKSAIGFKIHTSYKSPDNNYKELNFPLSKIDIVPSDDKISTWYEQTDIKLDNKGGKHSIKFCVEPNDSDDPEYNNCAVKEIDVLGGDGIECPINSPNKYDWINIGAGYNIGGTRIPEMKAYKAEAVLANDIYNEGKNNLCKNIIYDGENNGMAKLIHYRKTNSGFNGGLYKLSDGRYILAFGGTGAMSTDDDDYDDLLQDILATDANLLNQRDGYKSRQPDDALAYFIFLKKKYKFNNNNITVVGHSLGGALAQYVSAKEIVNAVTFNTAPYPYSHLRQNFDSLYGGGVTNIMTDKDPLTSILRVLEDIEKNSTYIDDKEGIEELVEFITFDLPGNYKSLPVSRPLAFKLSQNTGASYSLWKTALDHLFLGEYESFINEAKKAYKLENTNLSKVILGDMANRKIIRTGTGHGIADLIEKSFYYSDTDLSYYNNGIDGEAPKSVKLKWISNSGASGTWKLSRMANSSKKYKVNNADTILTTTSLTPTLGFSDFIDKPGIKHTATWFDVRRADDKKYLYDSGWMKGAITQGKVPYGYLEYNTLYRVRVVYRNSKGKLSKIQYSYFKTGKAPQLDIQNSEALFIGQTGAFIKAEIDLHNSDNIQGYVEYQKINDDQTYSTDMETVKKDSKHFYKSIVNKLECGTEYKYRVVLGSSEGSYKTFTTLPCGGVVQLSAGGNAQSILDFGNVEVGECAIKNITVTKMDSDYTVNDKLNFISDVAGSKEFSIENPEYHLTNKGETATIRVQYCPTQAHESINFISTRNGEMSTEKYAQAVILQGKGVEAGSQPFSGDFYLTNASVDKTTVKVGEKSLKVSVTQNYSGNMSESNKVYVGYYLSKDKKLDSYEKPLGSNHSRLSSSKTSEDEYDYIDIPSDIDSGKYYILFVADYKDQYDEGEDEDNNVKYVQITVTGNEDNKNLDISKEWIGRYKWSCGIAGSTLIRLSLHQNINNYNIDGNVSLFNDTTAIKYGKRLSEPLFDETGVVTGKGDANGNFLHLSYDSTEKISSNILSLELKEGNLIGTTMNGDGTYNEKGGISSNGCSENKGYSGEVYLIDRYSTKDTDNDGVLDVKELELGLDLNKADSDGDGYLDNEEIGNINHPRDTDDDGTIDALDTDSDNDGISDADEHKYGLNPLINDANIDSDGDGVSNIDEINGGSNPTDKNSVPKTHLTAIYFGKDKKITPEQEANITLIAEKELASYPKNVKIAIDYVNSTIDASDIVLNGGYSFRFDNNKTVMHTLKFKNSAVCSDDLSSKVTFKIDTLDSGLANSGDKQTIYLVCHKGLRAKVRLMQNGKPVSVIKDTSIPLIVKIYFNRLDNGLKYYVYNSDSELVDREIEYHGIGSFAFDLNGIKDGVYHLVVNIEKGNEKLKIRRAVVVKTGNKGIEIDSDGDGIEDSLDKTDKPNHLQTRRGSKSALIMVREGEKIALGEFALKLGEQKASIDVKKVKKPKNYKVKEVFDFRVSNLEKGESTYIVLPLKEPIGKNQKFVKYYENGDIKDFAIDNKNKIFTAKSLSEGLCPIPGSNRYKEGLNIGDNCIELLIEDGGDNDQDGEVNGEVLDPNAIVEEEEKQTSGNSGGGDSKDGGSSSSSSSSSSSGGGGGGGAMGYGFVLLAMLLMLFRRENAKKV